MKSDFNINKNIYYYKEEILPYYIILETTRGHVVIDSKEENLKHLLGIDKSFNIFFTRMNPNKFFVYLSENIVSVFELVNKEKYDKGDLSKDEVYIYGRNKAFIDIFNSLFYNTNIMIFKKHVGVLLDADYIQFCCVNDNYGYLGIVGGTNNDFYYFNSVILEKDVPKKYMGSKIIVKKVEKILKSNFKIEEYNIYPSKRKNNNKNNVNKKSKRRNMKKMIRTINSLLCDDLSIAVGQYGNNTIQVYRKGILIEEKLELPNEILEAKKIAIYIFNKYHLILDDG